MAPTDQSRASKRSSGLRQDLIPSLRGLLYYIKVAKIKKVCCIGCDSCAVYIQQRQQQQTTEDVNGWVHTYVRGLLIINLLEFSVFFGASQTFPEQRASLFATFH
ncbi:unnamed protein product, partial [Musa hybrid cultivar]